MHILNILFFLITGYYAFCTFYIGLYSTAGLFYKNRKYPEAKFYRKFAILVPAYKADKVIEELVENVLRQDYPKFDIIIIADGLSDEVLSRLRTMPVKVMEFSDENRTKALALNTIMGRLSEDYNIALILDSDNMLKETNYLRKLNNAFDSGIQAIQTHRTAKNTNTSLAVLDAISEEINNQLFRRGHMALGLSSALIGSGMAFDYQLFKQQMRGISSSGEDKELEMKLLRDKIRVFYINNLIVLDEKIQQPESFVNQRARWIANQVMQARSNIREGFIQLFRGNIDFFDKVLQHFLLPRILLLATVYFFTVLAMLFLPFSYCFVWFLIALIISISLLISVPRQMYNKKLLYSLLYLPQGAILMIRSLFQIKGATKKFHATDHGIIDNDILSMNKR